MCLKAEQPTDSVKKYNAINERSERSFDQSIIVDFKSDSDFIYEQPPETRPNFLRMLFKRIFVWLVSVLGTGVAIVVIIIVILIGAVGFGFALYGLFGIGKTIPIYNKEQEGLDYAIKEENIHEVNFAEEIDLAVEQKDFRKAMRLIYLYTLKLLSNHGVIEWLPSKTNHDYQYEIKNDEYQQQFTTLSYYFEYVWYGEFNATANQFEEMKSAFTELKTNLIKYEKD